MKNHRFPWLRNRTTDNRKCEKARNIKEKRTIEMFNTVSKQLVELRSSASADTAKYAFSKAPAKAGAFFYMPRSAKAGKNKLLAEMWEKRRKTEKNRISCCKTHGSQVIIP